jgi:hypothetical protein
MSDKLEAAEMAELNRLPAFRKFLWRSIQSAGILDYTKPSADGLAERNLFNEGRRSLGLDILRDAARGMPVDDPQAAFLLLIDQTLREEIQSTPKERHGGRPSRYDEPDDEDREA